MKIVSKLAMAAMLMTFSAGEVIAQPKHPIDIQMIDQALKTAQITKAQRAEVIKLRNEGYNYHYNTGDMAKAEIVLEKAKAILHIN